MYTLFGEPKVLSGGAKRGLFSLFSGRKKPSFARPKSVSVPRPRPMPRPISKQHLAAKGKGYAQRGVGYAKQGWKMLPPEFRQNVQGQLQQTGQQLLAQGLGAAQMGLTHGLSQVQGAIARRLPPSLQQMPPAQQLPPQQLTPIQQCSNMIATSEIPPAQQAAALQQCLRMIQRYQVAAPAQ